MRASSEFKLDVKQFLLLKTLRLKISRTV